jgi:branched-chain amino acid transport system ATP-binding protein
MIDVDSVSSFYGNAQALFDVSFEVDENKVISIIGPNGAGKTTLIDCITGFQEYNGSIQVAGDQVVGKDPWQLADRIGYCTEENNLFHDLTVEQNLRLNGPSDQKELEENLQEVFDLFPRLQERVNQTARTLSGGESKMLAIGRALMGDPEILVLDEPSLGLAPSVLADIDDVLEKIAGQGRTVLIAEQNVTFGMKHADKLILLESGEVQMVSDADEIDEESEIWETYMGR